MTTTLPTRIKAHIRDHITSSTSPLSLKCASLTTTLGYPITYDPEWTMLWKTLQLFYSDSATFIPNIANILINWCDAFSTWLESDENEEQVDKLLEELRARGHVKLVLEVSPSPSTRPTTTWISTKSVFIVSLPKAEPAPASTVLGGFSSDFLNLFTPSPLMQPKDIVAAPTPDDPEAWTNFSLDSPESHPIFTPRSTLPLHPSSLTTTSDQLPELSTIPRPEELLKTPPYHLTVRQEGNMRVVVNASHGPSLVLLEGYLKRWCRGEVNRVNRPPVVEIKLQESAFGLGLLNDTLVLEALQGREVSAMIVLVFVESMLGYTPVLGKGGEGRVWEFRRDRGFK